MNRLSYAIAFTGNLGSMREFYEEQVGLRVRRAEPQWVEFETAGAVLALHEMPDAARQGLVLRFETDDLEAVRRALASRGVPPCVPIEAPQGRLVDIRDPEGNLIQILQPGRASRARTSAVRGRAPATAGDGAAGAEDGEGAALGRVILNARDFGRAVSFYRGSMGFHPVIEAPHWAEFDTGGTRVAVHHRPVGEDHPRHAEQPISLLFTTGDLTSWCEAMRGRGLHFVTAPVMEEFGVYAEATDPDGRVVVFHEPPPPASLEEELAEAFEDDAMPRRAAIRKPVKKASATVSMMTLKPNYKSKEAAPKRRKPSATTTSVASVRGAGPDRSRLKPKRTADEKKARGKPAIGRDRKAELRTIASHKTEVARSSKRRPVKRASANSARRRATGRGSTGAGARRGGRG